MDGTKTPFAPNMPSQSAVVRFLDVEIRTASPQNSTPIDFGITAYSGVGFEAPLCMGFRAWSRVIGVSVACKFEAVYERCCE